MLDIGTGTGVLAIAAARALRRPVLASDIDPRAVAIARENTRINRAGAADRGASMRRVSAAADFAPVRLYDLVFANILLEPLIQLALPIARLVAPGGYVVLSGLLTAQAGSALARYLAARPRARTPHQARRLGDAGAVAPASSPPATRPSGHALESDRCCHADAALPGLHRTQ